MSLPNAFIAYLSSAGTITWTVALPEIYNDVVAVDIQDGGSNLAAALDSSATLNQAILILSKSSGSTVRSYAFSFGATMMAEGIYY